VKLSTKYQVLSDETSFMGVVKQKTKSDVESKKICIGSITGIQKKKSYYNSLNYSNIIPMSSKQSMGFGGFGGGSRMRMAAGGPPPGNGMAPGTRGGPTGGYGMAPGSRGGPPGGPPPSYGMAAAPGGGPPPSFELRGIKSLAKKSTGQENKS